MTRLFLIFERNFDLLLRRCSLKTDKFKCPVPRLTLTFSPDFLPSYSVPLWWIHSNGLLPFSPPSVHIRPSCNTYVHIEGSRVGPISGTVGGGGSGCMCAALHWSVPPYKANTNHLGNTTHCDPADISGTSLCRTTLLSCLPP